MVRMIAIIGTMIVFAVALVLIASLQWIFWRTALGRAFRATSDNQEIAQLMGQRSIKRGNLCIRCHYTMQQDGDRIPHPQQSGRPFRLRLTRWSVP